MTTGITHVVVRSVPECSYPVLVAHQLDAGWAAGIEPLSRSSGIAALCMDSGLPTTLRESLISEFETVFPGRLATINLSAGEQLKGFDNVKNLVKDLESAGVRRDGIAIAAGGGSVGDTVGFAAAIWHRGVPWAVVPTTLLAQVDSSIGGKVGVNLDGTKNLVGAYHQPSVVICDVSWLRSLPEQAYRAGLGEVAKYGLGMDRYVWDFLGCHADRVLAADPEVLLPLVRRCVSLKSQYVAIDQRDMGMRRYLNLGHTFGHALEIASGSLSHGEAVALGLLAATRLSIGMGIAAKGLDQRLQSLLESLSLPTTVFECTSETIMEAMEEDKKHGHHVRTFIVPTQIGHCRVVRDPPRELVEEALQSLFQ